MINAVGRRLFKEFHAGDLVSWKNLGNNYKKYGFIKKIYLKKLQSERSFVMAVVIKSEGEEEEFYAGMLNLESKAGSPE